MKKITLHHQVEIMLMIRDNRRGQFSMTGLKLHLAGMMAMVYTLMAVVQTIDEYAHEAGPSLAQTGRYLDGWLADLRLMWQAAGQPLSWEVLYVGS